MSGSRRKRQRTSRGFGAPLNAEEGEGISAQSQADASTSTSWSTREIPLSSENIPSLAISCLHAFVTGFRAMIESENSAQALKEWLKLVPDRYIPRLMDILKQAGIYPAAEFVATYLLRGSVITLDDNMPAIDVTAIRRRPETCSNLRELYLKNLPKITDEAVASVVGKLPVLRILVLRGCTKVGEKTVAAAAASCPDLSILNLNYTSVPPTALAPLLLACSKLETLKVAGITNWTATTVAKLWNALVDPATESEFVLPTLRSLKLKQSGINDQTLDSILKTCPNLRRLDVSFTLVRRSPLLLANTSLEKLVLTSTVVSGADLIKIVTGMTGLQTLTIGGLGRVGGSAVAVANTSVMTLSDEVLKKLTDVLEEFENLAHVNLAGNTKLGMVTRSALADFVARVGRKCQTLNLGGVSSLRSSQLEGLLAVDDEQEGSPLQVLVLNNTDVDDAAAPWIGSCHDLRVLEVGGTKFTSEGLFDVLDACPKLERLNLTSCRGVPLAHRRDFFAAYEKRKRGRQERGSG